MVWFHLDHFLKTVSCLLVSLKGRKGDSFIVIGLVSRMESDSFFIVGKSALVELLVELSVRFIVVGFPLIWTDFDGL